MQHRLLAAVLAAIAVPAAAQDTRPLIPILNARGIAERCETGLANARATIAAMEAREGGEGFFAEWNRLQIANEDAFHPISIHGSLNPRKEARDAAEPCLQKLTALGTQLFQSEKLFARLKDAKPANAREEKLRRNLMEGFEDSGIALPPDKRKRAAELFTRLEALRQSFERNVRDDPTVVAFTAAELEGVPEAFLKARKADAEGRYAIKPDDPSYVAVMTNAKREDTRKRMYFARFSKGGEKNLAILEEAFTLRRELASLYGLPTYAHYVQRRRMVGSPEVVNKFLGDVRKAVDEVEQRELSELAQAKAAETGEAQARIRRWDVAYYQERVKRERFAVDQEKLRRHFPTQKAVEYALLVSETLYGVKFREGQAPTWHPDVRYYEMHDAATGAFLANIYLDLYPRDGKRGGAWASGVRRASKVAGRTPMSVLVTNFNRQGLDAREMETLFHEFGHVLHGVLSQADYVSQAGTTVKRDFVEAPSQMFEEWVRREQPLALFRKVCPECPALSAEDIRRMEEARRYGAGIRYAGQWLLASFDMALSQQPQPPMEAWKRLESSTRLGYVEGVMRPASFAHIAGPGYAAGYYGYMWSEVIGLDLLSPFEKDMLDPKVGARYREAILSQGGQDEEMNLVKRFLGREPSSEAFFREITGKR